MRRRWIQVVEALMKIMKFGKHKGKNIKEVPSAYLAWVVEKLDQDDEVVKSARDELKRRTDSYDVLNDALKKAMKNQDRTRQRLEGA